MRIDWATLALQAVNFLILVWLLQRFLYRPVLAAIDRRRAASEAVVAKAVAAERQAEEARKEWLTRQSDWKAVEAELRRNAEVDAAQRAEAVLAEARNAAQRLVADGQEKLAGERATVAAALRQEAAGVATTLAGRLLAAVAGGSDGGGMTAEPFLSALVGHLAALAPEERAALLMAAGRGGLRVEVMPPLDPAAETRWRPRLREALGAASEEVAITFAAEPALIGGARIVTSGAMFGVDWASELARAESELSGDGRSS